MKKTQAQRLIEYLQRGRTITRLEAWDELGIIELSARVSEIQHLHPIERIRRTVYNRWGEKVSITVYSMAEPF
jgi:hypothetical protein